MRLGAGMVAFLPNVSIHGPAHVVEIIYSLVVDTVSPKSQTVFRSTLSNVIYWKHVIHWFDGFESY
jgi:hypothetical protein